MSSTASPSPIIANTEQALQNLSFDKEYQVLMIEMLGQDVVNNVLRRFQLDQNGYLMTAGDVGSTIQKRLDYDVRSDDKPAYLGHAKAGAITSDATWLISKLTYDGSARLILIQSTTGIWDNRASLTYT